MPIKTDGAAASGSPSSRSWPHTHCWPLSFLRGAGGWSLLWPVGPHPRVAPTAWLPRWGLTGNRPCPCPAAALAASMACIMFCPAYSAGSCHVHHHNNTSN